MKHLTSALRKYHAECDVLVGGGIGFIQVRRKQSKGHHQDNISASTKKRKETTLLSPL